MAGKVLSFTQFAPDISDWETSQNLLNVFPRKDGYAPVPSLQALVQALPAKCRGYFFARMADGSISVFAGTVTDLYRLNNTNLAWVRVSKGGVSYPGLVSTSNWQFAQFNDFLIAVQVNTVPQKFVLSSGSAFVDLGGSPPSAAFVSIINFFVVLTGLLSNPRRVQWSDLDGPEIWTAGTGLADFQDLADGGNVGNLSGGDAYGLIFQQESIRSLTYAPGSAVVFQITRISTQETLFADYSIINAGQRTFYCSAQGFKMFLPGSAPVSIGKERVDRFFFGDVDRNNLQLVIGATDPTATRVYWSYKSQQGSAGLFDRVLCYDWSISEAGQWTLLNISGQFIGSLAKPGLTLEQMDAIAPTPLTVSGAVAGTAGRVRLTLNAISNAHFAIAGQNFIVVQGVVGTTEANGAWPPIIVDATHIELGGSAFANAYVSGGAIGGSLDALTFSLDSISKSAVAALSAFDGSNQLGFFSGPNLEAVMETPEQDAEGQLVFVSSLRPITDCVEGVCSVGGRMTAQAAITYTSETAIDTDQGQCPVLIETRYVRGRLRCPAGAVWTYAKSLQVEASLAGDR